jgi:chromosome segregation ATPase
LRHFCYDDLLKNSTAQVKRLLRFGGMKPNGILDACVAVVDPRLRRQRVEQPAEPGEEPLELCRSVYVHLRALLADGKKPVDEIVDEVVRAGRAALKVLAPSPEERKRRLEIHFAELELAQEVIRDLRAAHDHAVSLAKEKEAEITRCAASDHATGTHQLEESAHQLEESTRSLTEHTAAYAALDAELKVAQATMRDLRIAHDRAASLAMEKEKEIIAAREAIVDRDLQLDESLAVLAERNATYAAMDAEMDVAQTTMRDLRIAHDRAASLLMAKETEIAAARQAIVERDHRLEEAARALSDLNEQLEKSTHTLAARNAAYSVLEAEMKLAQETIRDLRIAHDRAAWLVSEKEGEITNAPAGYR